MKLYGLTGVFIQALSGNGIFEGLGLEHNEGNNSLRGTLMDYYGPSTIDGSLNLKLGIMDFDKTYMGRGDVMNYSFKKQGEIWIGEWNYPRRFGGRALCELYSEGEVAKVDWEKIARTASFSLEDTEKWAESMTKAMVDIGYLEIISDGTGEKLLKLTGKMPDAPDDGSPGVN